MHVVRRPREEDPSAFRRNVRLSWHLMCEVLKRVEGECFVAHLEPRPGAGYDCLSLLTRDETGTLTTQLMLNRNGSNAIAGPDLLEDLWGHAEREGIAATSRLLIELSGLTPSDAPQRSELVSGVSDVVSWIDEHSTEAFSVGPIGWPSGCRKLRDIDPVSAPRDAWPITDHGPEVVLGIDGVEVDRRSLVDERALLAMEIARCTEIRVAVNDKRHPCHKVALAQPRIEGSYRQVPEAWVGDLRSAKLLVISSNPSISIPNDDTTRSVFPLAGYDDPSVPHADWTDGTGRTLDFQMRRFEQNRERPLVTTGAQYLCCDGRYRGKDDDAGLRAKQRYWSEAFGQARELIGEGFDLSRDLCLTEIVHCKSQEEAGVVEAAPLCAARYLSRVLALSSAPVVVIGGAKARDRLRESLAEDGLTGWDVSENFGEFLRSQSVPADHVGLYHLGPRRCVVVAVQQLSRATNRFRRLSKVLGPYATTRLSDVIRGHVRPEFESRSDVLEYLGLTEPRLRE